MKMILKYLFLLMTEFDLTMAFFEKLCCDPLLLRTLVERSQNLPVKDYFLYRFEEESKATLLALRQRIDALLVSQGVRLSLSAASAPDFAQLQDQGAIILINTAGRNITRGISELLQSLILSDIKQSVFRRAHPNQKFIWFCDEAQTLYKTSANRESMTDLLTMARSFGSFFVLLTQSLTSAVRDADVLNSILANVRWVLMLRSTLRDAQLIAPAIPVTGTRTKPQHNPFEPPKYMTESEELKVRLHEITQFPDRGAYCWLKSELPTALRITTPYLRPAHEIVGCSEAALAQWRRTQKLGQGVAPEEILQALAQQQARLDAFFHHGPSLPRAAKAGKAASKKKGRSLLQALEDDYT